MDLSLILPLVPAAPEQALPYARLVAEHGRLHRLWQGQSYGVESSATFSYLAGAGIRVPVGLSVLVTPLRHPTQAALEARSLAVLSGHSPLVGFGPASRAVQQRLLGTTYASPLQATEEFLLRVKQALNQVGPHDVAAPGWHRADYFVENEPLPFVPAPPTLLGLGVLRTGMARLAGRVADAAITWLTPASYLREVLVPVLEKEAADLGRPRPRVVALVPLAVARPGRDPLELAQLSLGGHLDGPHYAAMLRSAGVELAGRDQLGRLRAVVEGGVFGHGTPAELAGQLAAYRAAGVDEVVLNLRATRDLYGDDATLADLHELLAAVR